MSDKKILQPEYTPEEKQDMHQRFLDDLRSSVVNLSYWYPKVKDLGIATPKTVILPLPDAVIEASFMERPGDRETILSFVEKVLRPTVDRFPGEVFLKNGAFSDKFHFGDCHPKDKSVETLMRCLLSIQEASFIYDTGGNAEFVVREYIPAPEGTPTIYGGMPLRTEIRLFYDFDTHTPLYTANYWDWGYCHDPICDRSDADRENYEKAWPVMARQYAEKAPVIVPEVSRYLKKATGLQGIWSVDLLLDHNDKVWLIDMAPGNRSVYWDTDRIKQSQREQRILYLQTNTDK